MKHPFIQCSPFILGIEPVRLHRLFEDAVADLKEAVHAYDAVRRIDIRTRRRRAVQIAGKVSLLVANRGRNQIALLKQIGIADDLRLPDISLHTFGTVTRPPTHNMPLAQIHVEKHGTEPVFNGFVEVPANTKRLTIDQWWQNLIYENRGNCLTREELCWTMRSKDGYSHADAGIAHRAYVALDERGLEGVSYRKAGEGFALCHDDGSNIYVLPRVPAPMQLAPPFTSGPLPIRGGLDASVRTVATELLTALAEREAKDLVA